MSRKRMMAGSPTVEATFERVADSFAKRTDVERVTLFGFDCLRTGGRVFAKIDGDALVLKLGAARIEELAESGGLTTYAHASGRKLKDWARVPTGSVDAVVGLAEEARRFAAKQRG